MEILKRMDSITNEFAQLPQIGRFDLSLEAVGTDGTVKVIITGDTRKHDTAERIIHPQEDLSFIKHLFDYPPTFTPRSELFALDGLKSVYFDRDGYLMAVHDDSTERFKVDPKQREEVIKILREKLPTKFK